MQHLDEYVIGQEKAKKILAVAVYNHYSRVNENLRQQQIQESLTAISNSPVTPSSVYYGSSVLMSDGPSTPDPIIETFTSPSSPPSNASGTDAAGGSNSGSKDTHAGSSDLHVPGRRKFLYCPLLTPPRPHFRDLFIAGREQSCENSNLPMVHERQTLFVRITASASAEIAPYMPYLPRAPYLSYYLFLQYIRGDPLPASTAMDQLGLQWTQSLSTINVLTALRHIPQATSTSTSTAAAPP